MVKLDDSPYKNDPLPPGRTRHVPLAPNPLGVIDPEVGDGRRRSETLDAAPETPAEGATGDAEGDDPAPSVEELREQLRAMRELAADLDISRVQEGRRADELFARALTAEDELRTVRDKLEASRQVNLSLATHNRERLADITTLRRERDRLQEMVQNMNEALELKDARIQELEGFFMTPGPIVPESTHSRVAVFHESDGSVTIKVERSGS